MVLRQKGKRWYCEFMIDGRRYYKACKGATSEKEALKYEIEMKSAVMHGDLKLVKKQNNMKLSRMIEIYLDYSKLNKRSYANDVYACKYLKNVIGNKNIHDIKPLDIEKYKYDRAQKGIKPASINRELNSVSKMFSIAIENNFIDANPLKKVNKLRVDNHKIRFLTVEEQKKLFGKISEENLFLRPIIMMAIYTGMRKAEILGLKWECIDLTQNYIDVLKTKNSKARQIPISTKLKKELEQLPRDNEYIFINPQTQKPYSDIKKQFRSLCNEAGIHNFTFHDLRHTAATRMVENGIDLIVVQEILGHLDIKTTMRYAHPVPERKLKAVQILDKY